MSRVRPALAVLLLVVASATAGLAAAGSVSAPAAPVEPGDDPVVGVSENSTRVLLLTNADAAAFAEPSASVTDALSSGHTSLTATFSHLRVDARLEAARNASQRRTILVNATNWAESRVNALLQREQEARAAFQAGEITAAEYVQTLGTIHAKATELERYLGSPASGTGLYGYAESNDLEAITTRINLLRLQLATLSGPVRGRIAAVVKGDRESLRVHVTTGNGIMLSTLEDGTYVRETVRQDNFDEARSSTHLSSTELMRSLYPWAFNNTKGYSLSFFGAYGYFFEIDHQYGSVSSYVDWSTTRVFVEYQEKNLDQISPVYEYTASANNTTLLVSRTYAGGPVNVRVENATGAPLDAMVTLNGTALGETGADGELWALSPAGEYPVRVVSGDVRLAVNVTA
ncbi:MAG: hypothetical protein ABEJ90_04605, partial [Halobacterium sp.]